MLELQVLSDRNEEFWQRNQKRREKKDRVRTGKFHGEREVSYSVSE